MTVTFIKLGNLGRRGNMLFQAAIVICTALKNNDDYILPNCELNGTTNIPREKFTDIKNIKFDYTYEEPNFTYTPIIYKNNLNINGYRQSYKYHEPFTDTIKKLLAPSGIPSFYIGLTAGMTSVHVRRTDYLIHKDCYNILTRQNYYDKAMELINAERYLIFSDDIKWAKENFKGNEFEFSEGHEPHIDMYLQTSCDNNIIANSSFSWWGAYLNSFDGNKVIAPATWFGPKLAPTHDTKDLYVPGWIKI